MLVQKKSPVRTAFAALLVAGLLTVAPAAQAETASNEALVGAGSALATLLYGPTKLLYAAGGSIVAGLAWAWSAGDAAVMQPILTAAVRGDYVITPEHLRGERSIEFIGRSPEQRRMRQAPVPQDLGGEVLYDDGGF